MMRPLTLNGLAVAAVALASVLTSGGTVRAQSFEHIDRLAVRLQRQAEELHEEVHLHFRRTPQYRHLDRDVAAIERHAAHIHEVAHRGDVRHFRADVRELDRLVHHVEELVDDLGRFRQLDRRAYVHLRRSLEQVADTVHHLSEDLRR